MHRDECSVTFIPMAIATTGMKTAVICRAMLPARYCAESRVYYTQNIVLHQNTSFDWNYIFFLELYSYSLLSKRRRVPGILSPKRPDVHGPDPVCSLA